jgi:ABC-type amino acid transport substrate-binding protein
MSPLTFQGMFEQAEEEEVDFQFATPSWFACMGVEHGIRPLATVTSELEVRGTTYELNVYGGVIATRADRKDINGIEDLRDKIIGAGSITGALSQIFE